MSARLEPGARAAGGRARLGRRLRDLLVVAKLGISLVLLAGAGLLLALMLAVAGLAPAERAVRMQPLAALREE